MQVAWRRSIPAQPPAEDPGDPALIDQLRTEIARGGPITFARFMEVVLYDPERGYYATSTDRPTRAGDFLTAPEMHPIFGWVLARRIDALWREMGEPATFTLREYGAGSGALALAILDGLRRLDSGLAAALRYQPIDLPAQVARARDTLTGAGYGALLSDGDPAIPFSGAVIANEYLDALPVQRVAYRDGRLRELRVGWDGGRFVDVTTDVADARLEAWIGASDVQLGEGHVVEISLAMADWLLELGAQLERGAALVIDYGAGAAQLYGESRPTGTLRAFRQQHVSSDVLAALGHQDITASVDFDAFERAALEAGFRMDGRVRQAEFLLTNGLEEAYAEARIEADREWSTATALRSAVRRLIDTSALGGYTVATISKGL